ncbi:MAG: HAD family hydrolase [Acidimicrobiales bacterium]
MDNPIEAVTFDYWNTLFFEPPGYLRGLRLDAWERILTAADRPVERTSMEEAVDRSWRTFNDAWTENRQYSAVDAANLVVSELDLHDLADEIRAELVEVFITVGDEADLQPAPNIGPALIGLQAAGVRIGIICDVGMTPSSILRAHLERHGLLQAFDHWSFSDEVGTYKPDPRIFAHALDGLGAVGPDRAAHVGDLRRTDIAGALAFGMTAVRYTGVYDDPPAGELPEGDHVVADHAELARTLGL